MGARAWVRQTANEPSRNLIRLRGVQWRRENVDHSSYHGDKSGESLALNSVTHAKTQREAERPSRELRLEFRDIVTLSRACLPRCSRNTRSRSRSSTAFRSASTGCSEALSRCESKWKPGREVN